MTCPVPSGRILAIAATIVTIAAVGVSIALHPPGEIRKHRLDALRIQNLQRIDTSIHAYWRRHGALPADISTLESDEPVLLPSNDPDTKTPYIFEITGEKSYKLCADFMFPADVGAGYVFIPPQWEHKAGHYCYDLKIEDSERSMAK